MTEDLHDRLFEVTKARCERYLTPITRVSTDIAYGTCQYLMQRKLLPTRSDKRFGDWTPIAAKLR